jgi:arginine decarboxylase
VRLQLPALLRQSCEAEPVPVLTPAEAYQKVVRYGTEMVKITDAAERISAVMVVTYPPGVPTLMPGERTGPAQGPVLRFLSAIEEFDKKFPGFTHELHGIEADEEGGFWLRCIIETPATPPRRTPPLHRPSRSRSRARPR